MKMKSWPRPYSTMVFQIALIEGGGFPSGDWKFAGGIEQGMILTIQPEKLHSVNIEHQSKLA